MFSDLLNKVLFGLKILKSILRTGHVIVETVDESMDEIHEPNAYKEVFDKIKVCLGKVATIAKNIEELAEAVNAGIASFKSARYSSGNFNFAM